MACGRHRKKLPFDVTMPSLVLVMLLPVTELLLPWMVMVVQVPQDVTAGNPPVGRRARRGGPALRVDDRGLRALGVRRRRSRELGAGVLDGAPGPPGVAGLRRARDQYGRRDHRRRYRQSQGCHVSAQPLFKATSSAVAARRVTLSRIIPHATTRRGSADQLPSSAVSNIPVPVAEPHRPEGDKEIAPSAHR